MRGNLMRVSLLAVFAALLCVVLNSCPQAVSASSTGLDSTEWAWMFNTEVPEGFEEMGLEDESDSMLEVESELELEKPKKAASTSTTSVPTSAAPAKPAKQDKAAKAANKVVDKKDIDAQFNKFKQSHARQYPSKAAEARRRAIFEENMRIAAENNKASSGSAAPRFAAVEHTVEAEEGSSKPKVATKFDNAGPATFGLTPFADLTAKEFARYIAQTGNDNPRVSKLNQAGSKSANASVETKPKRSSNINAASNNKKKNQKKKFRLQQLEQTPVPPKPAATTPPPPPPPKKYTPGQVVETSSNMYNAQMNTNDDGIAQVYYTREQVLAFKAAAKTVPFVPFKSFNGAIDAPVDWSALSPIVRSIGACGACWAATAADLYQTSYFRSTGKVLPQVSMQYMMDCSGPKDQNSMIQTIKMGGGNVGCWGGSVMSAAVFLATTNGLSSVGGSYLESPYGQYYPDVGQRGMRPIVPPCRDNRADIGISRSDSTFVNSIVGFSYAVFPTRRQALSIKDIANQQMGIVDMPGYPSQAMGAPNTQTAGVDREVLLAQALNKYGPLAIAIDATGLATYTGGVLTSTFKCSNAADGGFHQALLVGLASSGAQQYWVIKNNWGPAWGSKGYLYLARGSNLCGITNSVVNYNHSPDSNDPITGLYNIKLAQLKKLGIN